MILVDTSAALQLASSTGSRHLDVLHVVEQLDGPFLLSPFILAELDYMLIERHGQEQQLALLSQVVDGAYELAEFGRDDVEAARLVMGKSSLRIWPEKVEASTSNPVVPESWTRTSPEKPLSS